MAKARKRMAVVAVVAACFRAAYLLFADVVVHVTGPAGVRIVRGNGRYLAGASSPGISYPTQIAGYGEPGMQDTTIRVTPDFIFPAFDGELLGSDRGE